MRMELIENTLTDGSKTYDLDIFDGLTEIQINMVQTDDLDARTAAEAIRHSMQIATGTRIQHNW